MNDPRLIALAVATLLAAVPADAQVYRCEVDGVVAFSDRPCGPDASLHAGGEGISFITPDENLPALAEAAQEFIRARREQAARRNERRATPAPPLRAREAEPETVFVPWPARRGRDRHPPRGHDRHRWDPAPHDIADNDRYSPLNGPILGTRENSAAFARQQEPRRRGDRHRQRQ